RVEIARLAGHALVDFVSDDVTDAAPILRRREIALADHLLLGENVPEAKVDAEPPVFLLICRAHHEGLRTDRPPFLKSRGLRHVEVALNESRRIDCLKKT